jgi:exosortase/archaeosortase family protein
MKSAWALIILQIAAFHPVWVWYVKRIRDGSDEPWGIVALGACVVLTTLHRSEEDAATGHFTVPAAATFIYAITFPFVPPLISACLAVTALGSAIGLIRYGSPFHLPMWGLLLLSLPVIASLQFYLGYPMRLCSGAVTAPMLGLLGYSVTQEGSCLRFGAELLSIDPPCSGVKMLWTGLFIAFCTAWCYGLSNSRICILAGLTIVGVIVANGVRGASLFFVELASNQMPRFTHDAVGLIVFALLAVGILVAARCMKGRVKCGA